MTNMPLIPAVPVPFTGFDGEASKHAQLWWDAYERGTPVLRDLMSDAYGKLMNGPLQSRQNDMTTFMFICGQIAAMISTQAPTATSRTALIQVDTIYTLVADQLPAAIRRPIADACANMLVTYGDMGHYVDAVVGKDNHESS